MLSLCSGLCNRVGVVVAAGFSSSIIVQSKDPSRGILWTVCWLLLESRSSES